MIRHPVFRSDPPRADDGRTVLALGLIRPYKQLEHAEEAARRAGARLLIERCGRLRPSRPRSSGHSARRPSPCSPTSPSSTRAARSCRRSARACPQSSTTSAASARWCATSSAGRVVPPDDVGALATALEELLDDEGALAAARAGAQRAREELTWDKAAARASRRLRGADVIFRRRGRFDGPRRPPARPVRRGRGGALRRARGGRARRTTPPNGRTRRRRTGTSSSCSTPAPTGSWTFATPTRPHSTRMPPPSTHMPSAVPPASDFLASRACSSVPAMRIEDYGIISDLQTAALVGPERLDRLALRPPLRLRRLLRRAPRRREQRPLAARPHRRGAQRGAALPPPHARARARLPHRHRAASASSTSCRRAARTPTSCAIVEGLEGEVELRMELVIRFDYGSIVPWVRRFGDSVRIAVAGSRRDLAADAGRGARREPHHRRDVHRRRPASACRSC